MNAQQAIIEAEYRVGVFHRKKLEFGKARTAWLTFLERHPLDRRAQRILFDLGGLYLDQAERIESLAGDRKLSKEEAAKQSGFYESAIAQWQKLLSKYPRSEEASEAQYRSGEPGESAPTHRRGLTSAALIGFSGNPNC